MERFAELNRKFVRKFENQLIWTESHFRLRYGVDVIHPKHPNAWWRRQPGRLRQNKVSAVLRALAAHREPEDTPAASVQAAHRYLDQRRAYLGYAGANAQGLNVGSDETESGHRQVIHQRLTLADSWWREPNAEKMLGLRVTRANHLWPRYWSTPKPTLN